MAERFHRTGEMLEDETDEDVIEGLRSKGEGEDVPLEELHVGQTGRRRTRAWASARDSAEMSTETTLAPGLLRATVRVWAPLPQPASSTRLPGGYAVS